jgi:hypothetical protein
MSARNATGQGQKTHEQQLRTLERKDDMPKGNEPETTTAGVSGVEPPHDKEARQSEFSVSRGGMHQESRDHNKHNNSGQAGHKPQKHSPEQEKR